MIRPKVNLAALAALAALGLAMAVFWPRHPAMPPAESTDQGTRHHRTTSVLPPRPAPVHRVLDETRQLNSPDASPQADAAILADLIRAFRRNAKGNPVGDNDEITAQLLGRDPRAPAVALIDPRHPAIDPEGRLVDRWGTPYFFHALSASHMEIRSAGPDRTMWTPDDIVGNGD